MVIHNARPLSHKCPIPYPIMSNFTLHVCGNFHVVNINVPAGVGAPPLDTQLLNKLVQFIPPVVHFGLQHRVDSFTGIWCKTLKTN